MIAPTRNDEVPTLLVAENEAQHRFVLKRVFRSVGMNVRLRFVEDGKELLDYLERTGAHADPEVSPWPDLVLIDLHMPRLDGIATLEAMRASRAMRTLPAIVFSSSDQPHHIDRAYSAGANAYLVKVGDFKELVAHLRGMVGFWLRAARLPSPPRPEATPVAVRDEAPDGLPPGGGGVA